MSTTREKVSDYYARQRSNALATNSQIVTIHNMASRRNMHFDDPVIATVGKGLHDPTLTKAEASRVIKWMLEDWRAVDVPEGV